MSLDLTSDFLQFNFTMPKGSKNGMYSFDRFKLDGEKLMLYRDGEELVLAPKIIKTLAVLIENRGSILSKDELIEKVWDDSIVEESNLSQNLYILRKTLGTKPGGGQYIETLRRRGYRFSAEVKSHSKIESVVQHDALSSSVSLIGRDDEIEEVAAILSRDDVRLVTISGVGGVGKTTLARAVADKLRIEREVFFVELAAITRADLVVSAIASALGLKDSGDGSLLERIKETLEGRSVLLVLDNFEQVVSAAPLLTDLLNSNTYGLKILVTSRVTLRLKAETMYVLPPLQVPSANDKPSQFAEISRCEAVSLFVERAKQVRPQFELIPENAADVASICTHLGGLPLAIELAAARMRILSPEAVRTRLKKQLDVLQGVTRDAPQRQQTMRETIAWSYDLLIDQEKQVFARLGVFSGGFDLAAAEFVCSDLSGGSAVTVLDAITSLVEHNLLAARNALNGEPRIYMLEVVREFADEVLTESGEVEKTRRAHAEYFLRLGEEAEPQLLAARSAGWLDRLETEHDNLRATLAWSTKHDPPVGQRLAGAIWRFWWLHGHIREACEQLDDFLSVPGADPETRAKMLTGATFLNRLAGNSDRSRIYAEEGVELASSTGDLRTGALSLNQLGFLALDIGDFPAAERMFRRGLRRAEELGDIQVLALLNNGLGELSRSKGDYAQAAEYYGRALEYNREAGDRVRQTTCLINLGATALMQNDRESAGEFYRNGLEISSEMEDMNGTLYCLEGMAGSYWAIHDPERAGLIFGAAHAGRYANNLLLEPADKIPYEQSLALVRNSLGTDSFDLNFSKGAEMGIKAAVTLALDNTRIQPRSAAESRGEQSREPARGQQVVVERQGNVLRLVEWPEPTKPNGQVPAAGPALPREGSHPRYGIAVVLLVIAAATGAVLYLYSRSGASTSIERQNDQTVTRLTNTNYVRDATISRDGNYFVYNEALVDSSRVWLQQTGKSVRVEIVPGGKWQICCKTFSPDGKFVYFMAANAQEKRNDLYRVATLGGPPEKLFDGVSGYVSFSPDGTEMLFLRIDPVLKERSLVIAPSDGKGGERQIFKSDENLLFASWSPDGKRVAFQTLVKTPGAPRACVLSTLDLASGEIKPISDERWGTCYRMEWLRDGSGIVMVGTREGETNSSKRDQVYLISYPEGISRRLTTEGSRHESDSLGVTDDGAILAVPYNRSSQIWSMEVSGDSRTAVQLTSGAADGRGSIASLPDGRVAYVARSGDALNNWVMNADGSNQTQVGDASAVQDLIVTPDGKYLLYSNETGSDSFLYRAGIDGSDPVTLTRPEEYVVDSAVSPDGTWVAYDVWRTNGVDHDAVLKKIPFNGGDPIILSSDGCSVPHFSPDGASISCVNFSGSQIAVLSAEDGSRISVFDTVKTPLLNSGAHWTPDGKALVYIVHQKSVCNLWMQPINGERPKPLTAFTSGSCYSLEFSRDGSRLYIARGDELRDAVLIKNYK
jgi:predicted ATPase/DNA-binding winged helix-turn-helix (wHTH) protein/Tol biopolymer transport system component